MIKGWELLLIVLLCALCNRPGFGAERYALIVGNSDYSAIGRLKNPASDAQLMSDTLTALNFRVSLLLDASQRDMKQEIANFGRMLRAASNEAVGFFYYAGHGIQAGGRNYLLPIEATPTDQADLDLMGVEANWILRQMESAGNRTNIIVLDACRNNPFTTANRSLGRGLAQIDAPTGSFISYSTAPGKVALDGDQINSPFTSALARALQSPGLGIEQVFKMVRREVISVTGGGQTPWDSSSLIDDFYPMPRAVAESVPETDEVSRFWQNVRSSGDPNRVALFLSAFPESEYAREASQLLTRLIEQQKNNTSNNVNDSFATANDSSPVVPDETQLPKGSAEVESGVVLDRRAFAKALESGTREQFEGYLSRFPEGIFVRLAKRKLSELSDFTLAENRSTMTFDQAWIGERYNPERLSIKQLVNGLPLYPPYEGMAVKEWATVTCSQCHNWSKTALCKQGEYYRNVGETALVRSKHPYGGFLKRGVKRWAELGCN